MNPVLEARMQRRQARHAAEVRTRVIIEGDQLRSVMTQDCTDIADRAYAMHKEGMHGSGEMRLAGTIPNVIIQKYMDDNGVTYEEFMANDVHMRRVLNNPDNKMFRVWTGRV